MSEKLNSEELNSLANDSVKELADALKKISDSGDSFEDIVSQSLSEEPRSEDVGSTFKVATNLPEKTSTWTKIRNALLYEVKVELTPRQQKIEDDINSFLHKEITWDSFKSFLFKEVPITYKGKRVF